MVILNAGCIEKRCSQIELGKSLSKRLKKGQLQALTHLRMNDMFIDGIGSFDVCNGLRVIYLQNNNISKIENLQFASNLTHLYLQHNMIVKMENLVELRNLETLYLGHNNIMVIEGLEHSKNLTVLNVENQKIDPGGSLCFDPRSMRTLSTCLKVLNISANKITSLNGIRNLYELEVLDARKNCIGDVDDLTENISTLVSLKDLSLEDNPVTRRYRYKENLIANSDTIEKINGKVVTDISRSFLRRFKIEKHNRHTRTMSKVTLDEDIASSLNLPPAFKRSISRAIFQYSQPKLSINVSTGIGLAFPPWKTAPGANAARGNHVTPRPFWGNVTKTKEPSIVRSFVNIKPIALPPI